LRKYRSKIKPFFFFCLEQEKNILFNALFITYYKNIIRYIHRK